MTARLYATGQVPTSLDSGQGRVGEERMVAQTEQGSGIRTCVTSRKRAELLGHGWRVSTLFPAGLITVKWRRSRVAMS